MLLSRLRFLFCLIRWRSLVHDLRDINVDVALGLVTSERFIIILSPIEVGLRSRAWRQIHWSSRSKGGRGMACI